MQESQSMTNRKSVRGLTLLESLVALIVVLILVAFGTVRLKERRDAYRSQDEEQLWRYVSVGATEDVRRTLSWGKIDIERYHPYNDSRIMDHWDPQACRCHSLLGLAALRGHSEIAELLIKAGANPNGAKDSYKKMPPPLFWAVVGRQPGMVDLLLDNGANPGSENSGHTLIEWAKHDLNHWFLPYEISVLVAEEWPPEAPPQGWKQVPRSYMVFSVPSELKVKYTGAGSMEARGPSVDLRIRRWILPDETSGPNGEPITLRGVQGYRDVKIGDDDGGERQHTVTLQLYPQRELFAFHELYVFNIPAKIEFTAECDTKEALETVYKIFDSIRFPL